MFSSTLVKSIQVNGIVIGEGTDNQAILEFKHTLYDLGVSQEIERYGFQIVDSSVNKPVGDERKISLLFSN